MKISRITLEPGEQLEIVVADPTIPEMLLPGIFIKALAPDRIVVLTALTIEEFPIYSRG